MISAFLLANGWLAGLSDSTFGGLLLLDLNKRPWKKRQRRQTHGL